MSDPTRSTTPAETTLTVIESEESIQQKRIALSYSFSLVHRVRVQHYKNFSDLSPLHGIRVLDLTRIIAGPFCSMILGDLGAEIIKIEKPGSGDESRNWGPPFIEGTRESCYFAAINRNKKSVCVDFSLPLGREIIYDLASKSDVVIENYVPGKLEELKLGYENLKSVSPNIIYCSISGYGPDGPYKFRPGYDVIAASVGGLLHITGTEEGEPCKVGVPMTDLATGLFAHGAIMAALLQRTRTGQGQKIDCDLFSTQVFCLINVASNYLNAGWEAKRWGTAHSSIVPYQAFPTSDGHYITIGAGSNQQFRELCKKLNLIDLTADERFSSNEKRVNNRKALIKLISSRIKEKSVDEWRDILSDAAFPNGPINSIEKVMNDEQIKYQNLIQEMEHPSGKNIKLIGPPVKYSMSENKHRYPPPLLGQHTNAVLMDILGYHENKIINLKENGIVQ